jgi:alkylation response protein AidB-like acyl-CoA dehydrogenase
MGVVRGWFVPAEPVGGDDGIGRATSRWRACERRLQTAARAVGVMQAAFDAGFTRRSAPRSASRVHHQLRR